MASIHYYQHALQRKTPQLAPTATSGNHLKFAAMRTMLCRVQLGYIHRGAELPIETFDPEGRG